MRKCWIVLLICLCLPLTALADLPEVTDQAILLARHLDMLVKDPDYMRRFTPNSTLLDRISELSAGERDLPSAIAHVTLTPAGEMNEQHENALGSMAINRTLGAQGTVALAVSNIMRSRTVFCDDITGTGCMFLFYEDAAPVAVAWQGREGAVELSACCIRADTFGAEPTAESIEQRMVSEYFTASCTMTSNVEAPEPTVLLRLESPECPVSAKSMRRMMRLSEQMAKNAADPEYLKDMGVSSDANQYVTQWAAGHYERPTLAVSYNLFSEENLVREGGASVETMPEAIRWEMLRYLDSVAGTQLAARKSVSFLVASSACTASDLYADADMNGRGNVIFLYEDGAPVSVYWEANAGAVTLTAHFLPMDDELQACKTAEDVRVYLAAYFGEQVMTEELSLPAAEPTPTPYFAPNVIPTATPMPTVAPVADDFMSHAVEIAHRISVMAGNPRTMGGYHQEYVKTLIAGDHTLPQHVFHVSGETLAEALTGGDASIDFTRPEMRRDLVVSLPEMLWGPMEATHLEVLSMLARYKVFASGREGCGLYVMLYGEGEPIVLPWYSEQGAVSITAVYMPDAALKACTTAEEISTWFAGKGLPVVAFEEVEVR